jgi:hypothetical protein
MKTKVLLYGVIFIVIVLVSVSSFAVEKNKYGFYEPSPNEVMFGTWVNTENSGGPGKPQKIVSHPWGAYDIYMLATNKTPNYRGSRIIVDKWLDSKGNTWYKIYNRENWTDKAIWALERVNKDGKFKEYVWSHIDFPSEADLNSKNAAANYGIMYRQE